MLMPCEHCGYEVAEGAYLCPKCGGYDPSGSFERRRKRDLRGCLITMVVGFVLGGLWVLWRLR